MAECPVGLEAVDIGRAYPAGHTVELRFVPGDWKRDGCVEEGAEIVRAVGVLPEVVSIDEQPRDQLSTSTDDLR